MSQRILTAPLKGVLEAVKSIFFFVQLLALARGPQHKHSNIYQS